MEGILLILSHDVVVEESVNQNLGRKSRAEMRTSERRRVVGMNLIRTLGIPSCVQKELGIDFRSSLWKDIDRTMNGIPVMTVSAKTSNLWFASLIKRDF
jgi:hypothetical protein